MLKLFLLGLVVIIGVSCNAMAQESAYTVRDIPVSAQAADANTARMAAMEQAEQKAFIKLLEQALPPEQAAAKAATVPPQAISGLVTGYDVKNEKISAQSYGASIDVSFDPQKTDTLLNKPAASAPAAAHVLTSPSSAVLPSTVSAGKITALSRLSSVQDWVRLRKRLGAIPAISKVELSAISQQQADIVLYYNGGPAELEAALQSAGLQVAKSKDYWIIGL